MSSDELAMLIHSAAERQDVELKSGGPVDQRSGFTGRAVRAVLGLANLRDGGTMVVGVRELSGTSSPDEGISPDDARTWTTDNLMTLVNNYADPSVELDVRHLSLNEKIFVVVRVEPFAESPVLCRKTWTLKGRNILREGALYVRSRKRIETTEVSTSEDMRAVLQLAVEKRLADFIRTTRRAQLTVSLERDVQTRLQQFNEELGTLGEL